MPLQPVLFAFRIPEEISKQKKLVSLGAADVKHLQSEQGTGSALLWATG